MKIDKKQIRAVSFLLVVFGTLSAAAQRRPNPPQLGKNSLKEVVNAMTLEEKAELVVGMGFKMPGMPPPAKGKKPKPIDLGGYILPATDPGAYGVPEKVAGSAGRTHAIPRLGIPSLTLVDGPAGLRMDPMPPGAKNARFATAFPVGTLLASSWDTALVRKVGMAMGNEVREYGGDILLAPAINIQRNPLGGRNFEYYSEDPLVSGCIAAAMIRGIQLNGVGTSLKHFAANNQETNRMRANTLVSERALREIYLEGFQIAVKNGKPWTVMSSYNKINGSFTSESKDLLTDILRKEWRFDGFVMTDFMGGTDPVAQMNAGNDWLLPGYPDQSRMIADAVKNGSLGSRQLDANVGRILQVILKSPAFKHYKYSNNPDLAGHARIAREASSESMVLLENKDRSLPLKPGIKLAVFGNAAYHTIAGGTGSGNVNQAYVISLAQGLGNAGYRISQSLDKKYRGYLANALAAQPRDLPFYLPVPAIPEIAVQQVLPNEADEADAAIITIGRTAGEWNDLKIEEGFQLSAAEHGLIDSVAAAFHARNKKVVVVLNIGGPIETAGWRDQVDAILLAWQPGQEAGNAVADVLSGKVNPSGKLATTFPVKYDDVPSARNFPGKELLLPPGQTVNPMIGRPAEVTYQEGVYLGYRYYDTYKIKPAYEFGYGLSYTRFTLTALHADALVFKKDMTFELAVTNTGAVPGKEVVQLYLTAPRQVLDKPGQELKAFAKTALLAPGESQRIVFRLSARDLASFDAKRSAWIAEKGTYRVQVGCSSRNLTAGASFSLEHDIVAEPTHQSLRQQQPFDELNGN